MCKIGGSLRLVFICVHVCSLESKDWRGEQAFSFFFLVLIIVRVGGRNVYYVVGRMMCMHGFFWGWGW
jgi:hypothetical protein